MFYLVRGGPARSEICLIRLPPPDWEGAEALFLSTHPAWSGGRTEPNSTPNPPLSNPCLDDRKGQSPGGGQGRGGQWVWGKSLSCQNTTRQDGYYRPLNISQLCNRPCTKKNPVFRGICVSVLVPLKCGNPNKFRTPPPNATYLECEAFSFIWPRGKKNRAPRGSQIESVN